MAFAAFTSSVWPGVRAPQRGAQMCARAPKSTEAPSAPKPRNWVPMKEAKSTASWKTQHIEIFGSKGTGSRPDWDLRPKSERAEADGVCPNCEGSGVQTCSLCEGFEYGDGGKVRTCPACNGKVHIMCTYCGGTKKQVELTEGWWEKGIAALYKE